MPPFEAEQEEETAMFNDRRVTVMLPAKDVDRAVAWYRDKLGLSFSKGEYGATLDLGGGVPVFLYQSSFAGTAKHTLLSFEAADLAADMAALRAKGVRFLDYDLPDLKTENGVADFGPVKNAWAEDSEGNILGFVEGM
jgi:catechol 2,3-dioxygenase-like lactoylglutathione lyase family enzyme